MPDGLNFPIPCETVETEGDEVCRVLRRAADVMRERGWGQGRMFAYDGTVCFWGAVRLASGLGEDETVTGIPQPVRRELESRREYHAWADWNDAPGRTQAEVITALESAASARARRLRAGGG